jgi:AbrB family looped-hinge helix DNA binding protein
MKATITSKGQITIPIKIRRKLNLKPGHILEFDENAGFLKATKAFDDRDMHAVIGCCRDSGPNLSLAEWLEESRGPVELPRGSDEDGN